MRVRTRDRFRGVPFLVSSYRFVKRQRQQWKFVRSFARFRAAWERSSRRLSLAWADRYPCLGDDTETTPFDRHYVYHTAWAARVVAELQPAVHVDISSDLRFCTLVSAFVPINFYDYRPADLQLDGLKSGTADLTRLAFPTDSVESLSCMHVVEHIGLGRYGDPIDPDGDLKAMAELKRVLAPGGQLLFVVPVGKPRIMFNAHRIYSYDQVIEYFGDLRLQEFALIPDDPAEGGLVRQATKRMADRQAYGCGCFAFTKS
jgi:SAM-dependent methyltransferase